MILWEIDEGSNDERVQLGINNLPAFHTRAKHRKVHFSKIIHLCLRDGLSPILKVYDSHGLSFGTLSVAVGTVQGPAVMEGGIAYIKIISIHLPSKLRNRSLKMTLRFFRNWHHLQTFC